MGNLAALQFQLWWLLVSLLAQPRGGQACWGLNDARAQVQTGNETDKIGDVEGSRVLSRIPRGTLLSMKYPWF